MMVITIQRQYSSSLYRNWQTLRRNALRALRICLLLLCPCSAFAHEVWIEPVSYRHQSGADFIADTKIGQRFKGSAQYYVKETIVSTGVADPVEVHELDRVSGDIPAMKAQLKRDGLHVAWMHTQPDKLHYKTFDKFKAFVTEQGLSDIADQHKTQGLPLEDFSEAYSRCSKSLFMVGDATSSDGLDSARGMPIELVALANPYQMKTGERLAVRLLWQSQPLATAQIMIFRKAQDSTVKVSTTRTDAAGIAHIELVPGDYLLNAVNIISWQGQFEPEALWHSYWASMTFQFEGQLE